MKANALRFGLALLAAGALLGAGAASAQIKINEVRIDHTGTDSDEYFELSGSPGASLAGYTYLVIGDAGTGPSCGNIETFADLGAYVIQADGLLCLRNTNSAAPPILTGYDGDVPLVFENSDNLTHMLVTGFTGTLGQDLDTNDDGVLDVTPWTSVADCIGLDEGTVPNCTTNEYLYCATTIGPDGINVPGHVYRYSDTQTWAIGPFDLAIGKDSPGTRNHAQFEPDFVEMTRTPCVPVTGQQATVVALVENDPTSAELHYTVNGGTETVVAMTPTLSVDDSVYYQATIPAQAVNGTLVEYYVIAHNATPDAGRSYDQGYFVGTMAIANLRVNDVNGRNIYAYYGARVRGNVTAAYDVFSGVYTDYYVQDATGGIIVWHYFPHTVQPALGADVTVIGSLSQYRGKLELAAGGSCDTVLVTNHGPGTAPAPLSVNACDLGEQHEGLLVRVQDMVIDTRGHTTFFADSSYRVSNCYNDLSELRIDGDTNIGGSAITTSHLEVVGLAGQFDTSMPYTTWYQVTPRAVSDITFLSMTSVPSPAATGEPWLAPCAPNPLLRSGEIRFQVPARGADGGTVPVRLAVYDLSGRLVTTLVDGPMTPGVHGVPLDRAALGEGSGVFFCRLRVDGTTITRTLVALQP